MATKEKEQVVSGRYRVNSNYDQSFIKKVVQAVEDGLPQNQAIVQYGMSRTSLREWMDKYGSAAYHANKKRTITPQIRRSAVRAVNAGTMTVKEAAVSYGVSNSAIKDWRRQFFAELTALNQSELSKKKTDKPKDTSSTSADVAALQQHLADAQLKIAALNTLIDVAEEQLKINIRKKPGARQS